MSIALDFHPISSAVRRGGTQLDRYSSTITPPLRTALGFRYVPGYKHLTPTEGRTSHNDRSLASLAAECNLGWNALNARSSAQSPEQCWTTQRKSCGAGL